MEDKKWLAVTAIAPIAWGSTYYVTRHALPPDAPLWGAVLRALPAGLLLLLVVRRLPRGAWWWKSLVLGTLNMGAFFVLVYAAGQLLPTSLAATLMSLSPIVMMLFAWGLLAERPSAQRVTGALVGIVGVALMVGAGGAGADWRGIGASVAAMVMSAAGFALTKRWGRPQDVVAGTAWQLVAGGLCVLPAALLVEGGPPPVDGTAVLGFAYVAVVATAIAYVAWFTGLAHLPAGAVGLVGLLNPVTGVVLGTALGGESLTAVQVLGLVVVLAGLVIGQRRSAEAPVDVVLGARVAR
ncbi:DMT family transporter [Cellulomonas rhizosphaerae]|uniref:DMT family transporter n=1 Tax=Cellulomonas rhizosphaerae TaxID=2293719 RepID=UPI001F3B8B38|nr:DMT family transporter [Cellulomonas rhizosphaerae]